MLLNKAPKNSRAVLIALFCCILGHCWNASAGAQVNGNKIDHAQPQNKIESLEIGQQIEREIDAAAVQTYSLEITAGQFLSVRAEKQGIDLLLAIVGPDNKELLETNSPNGSKGEETLFWIAETTGSYQIKIHSLNSTIASGRYQLTIKELRAANDDDRNLIKAELAIYAGLQLTTSNNIAALQQAVDKFKTALALWQLTGQQLKTAYALDYLGQAYDYLGEPQLAIDCYNQSLQITRALNDQRMRSILLNNLGLVYRSRKEFSQAAKCYNEALDLARNAESLDLQPAIINNLANLCAATDDRKLALEYYQQLLSFNKAGKDKNGEGQILYTISEFYRSLGDIGQSASYLEQAAMAFNDAGNVAGEIASINGIALIYRSLGDKQQSLNYYNRALTLAKEKKEKSLIAATLIGIGGLCDSVGEKQSALDYYQQAVPLVESDHNNRLAATVYNNIGLIYKSLGEREKAIDYYQQALSMARVVSDRQSEATTLHNLANNYDLRREGNEALNYLTEALQLERELKDDNGEIYTLSAIGSIKYFAGEQTESLKYQEQALNLARLHNNRRGQALALNGIGLVYQLLDQPSNAIAALHQALPLWQAMNDLSGQAATLFNIATIERQQEKYQDALEKIKTAVDLIESMRASVVSQELRSSFFASAQDYYELYIDILMRLQQTDRAANYQGQALQASERARARSLLELLAEAHADIRKDIAPELLERERRLQQLLNIKEQNRLSLEFVGQSQAATASASREVDKLLQEYQQLETEIRQNSPHYAMLTQPQPLALSDIQAQLNDDTLLLEYFFGNERSYLWVVSNASISSFILAGQDEINSSAEHLYQLLTKRNAALDDISLGKIDRKEFEKIVAAADAEYPRISAELSQLVLKPAASQLGKKRLLIVADGALQYIPFNVLMEPAAKRDQQTPMPLILNHEIVSLPSISAIAESKRELAGRKAADKMIAVLADPVFDKSDIRIKELNIKAPDTNANAGNNGLRSLEHPLINDAHSNKYFKVERLPYTAEEARRITSLVPEKESLKAMGLLANRVTATSANLSHYQYVHFATHGYLDAERPELSALLLSLYNEKGEAQDGFLRAHEIFNLNIPAEMVVLSACETGLGKEVKGEGLIGLSRGFMYAGARRVVVSLWSINDHAATELMARFYQKVIVEKLPPAAALRGAQIELIKETKYAAPFYWAAFIVEGEWQ